MLYSCTYFNVSTLRNMLYYLFGQTNCIGILEGCCIQTVNLCDWHLQIAILSKKIWSNVKNKDKMFWNFLTFRHTYTLHLNVRNIIMIVLFQFALVVFLIRHHRLTAGLLLCILTLVSHQYSHTALRNKIGVHSLNIHVQNVLIRTNYVKCNTISCYVTFYI